MSQESIQLPHELLATLRDLATQFGTSPERILERAIHHYLNHVEELRTASTGGRRPSVDWAAAKETLQASKCLFDECPYSSEGCPVEVCPL